MSEEHEVFLCQRIATEAHKGQKRRGGSDYINHPRRVAELLDCNTLKCVAWLHDVLEDTDETSETLRSKGVAESIIFSVEKLTKNDDDGYMEYILGISMFGGIAKVKIADMIDNLLGNPTDKQKSKYRDAMMVLLK